MPRILDNIEQRLSSALDERLSACYRADICVGYFNLRGWGLIGGHVDGWSGEEGNQCRLLIGMQRPPDVELRRSRSFLPGREKIDNEERQTYRKQVLAEFRRQLTAGAPSLDDERVLRMLARQIRERKLAVRLFLRHPLHAKLYLLHREDPVNPSIGIVGSSNLTRAGLSDQGELNVEMLDGDTCDKLSRWFQDRWDEKQCEDVSAEVLEAIEQSWVQADPVLPYHIYLKMAYQMSEEARSGISEFQIPSDIDARLHEFQKAAVRIAARHLNTRNGVILGDVVGLGKTLMACTLARIFEDDYHYETLVICPKNLVSMWEDYVGQYRLRGKVVSLSRVQQDLPDLRRFRLLILDESHNLRNRKTQRYEAVKAFVEKNECKCILLSATPYNKHIKDISNQLRLFVAEDAELDVSPSKLLSERGVAAVRQQVDSEKTLKAFELSESPEDWQTLLRQFLVRRTRHFVQEHYAKTDDDTGRKYLVLSGNQRSYFPQRTPRNLEFESSAQYEQLYSDAVVDVINDLQLPRYGLGNYVDEDTMKGSSLQERETISDLSRAGKALMGFCRINLFKRLESSGSVFLQSLERHVVRNHIVLHALKNNLDIPIGTADVRQLDPTYSDVDWEEMDQRDEADDEAIAEEWDGDSGTADLYQMKGRHIYDLYSSQFRHRFRWLRAQLFRTDLVEDLMADTLALTELLEGVGAWSPEEDTKLGRLHELLTVNHGDRKVLIFSQFADTVDYLRKELRARSVESVEAVTGDTKNPASIARRFSPGGSSTGSRDSDSGSELRVLVATDIMSEGQNLQDCSIVVNYDLPWTIIRLVQRAGRVDRIGQSADEITCYSFLPEQGVDDIIRLRSRVRDRLRSNQELIGSDEKFFEGDKEQNIRDLYSERSSVLDEPGGGEVDPASYALEVWNSAVADDPKLRRKIENLPFGAGTAVVRTGGDAPPAGAIVCFRIQSGGSVLFQVDRSGRVVSQDLLDVLHAAQCEPDEAPVARTPADYELVGSVAQSYTQDRFDGLQIGPASGVQLRVYRKLERLAQQVPDGAESLEVGGIQQVIRDLRRYPLQARAETSLVRQLDSGASDDDIVRLVTTLIEEDNMFKMNETLNSEEPTIVCSLAITDKAGD